MFVNLFDELNLIGLSEAIFPNRETAKQEKQAAKSAVKQEAQKQAAIDAALAANAAQLASESALNEANQA